MFFIADTRHFKTRDWMIVLLPVAIFLALIFLCSCSTDETPQQIQSPPSICLDTIGNVTGTFEEMKPKASVCKYRYNNQTCTFKFLFDCDSLGEDDVIVFTADDTERVGNAFYVRFHTDTLQGDTLAQYHYAQGRETYKGVFNNDAVCDNMNINSSFPLHIKFTDCVELNADTLYLTKL